MLLFLILIGGCFLAVSGLWILPAYFIVAFGIVPLAIMAIVSSIDTFAAWVRRNL